MAAKKAEKREFYIESIRRGSNGCCGISELYGFEEWVYKKEPNVADTEWLLTLYNTLRRSGVSVEFFGPIVLFSGNDIQGTFKFSPHGLAKWLLSKGEKVVNSSKVRNNNSTIQAFLWTPSAKFRARLKRFINNENKKIDAESRAEVA